MIRFGRSRQQTRAGALLCAENWDIFADLDNDGLLLDSITYSAFGQSSEDHPEYGGRYKWTSREFDVETGLQFNRARYYDADTGRWISQDPLGFDAGDSNLYRYVANRPVQLSDPSGKLVRDGVGFWYSTMNPTTAALSYKGNDLGQLIAVASPLHVHKKNLFGTYLRRSGMLIGVIADHKTTGQLSYVQTISATVEVRTKDKSLGFTTWKTVTLSQVTIGGTLISSGGKFDPFGGTHYAVDSDQGKEPTYPGVVGIDKFTPAVNGWNSIYFMYDEPLAAKAFVNDARNHFDVNVSGGAAKSVFTFNTYIVHKNHVIGHVRWTSTAHWLYHFPFGSYFIDPDAPTNNATGISFVTGVDKNPMTQAEIDAIKLRYPKQTIIPFN